MTDLAPLGHDRQGRTFYLLSISSLDDWPTAPALPSPHFALFLACNAKVIGRTALSRFAAQRLGQGLAQLCAWGPGASLTVDVFEDAYELDQNVDCLNESWVQLASSWHGHDTLEHALEFFFDCAQPSDRRADCRVWIAAAIDMPQVAEEMGALLHNWVRDGINAA